MAEFDVFAIEEWRPVVGYEGWYEVSDLGRVKRVVGGSSKTYVGKILKPVLFPDGYHQVGLSVNGRAKMRKIHHLVMAAFVGPRPEGYQINHIDGIKTHNRLSNLEYATAKENAQHAWAIGLNTLTAQKLTPEIVKELKLRRGTKSQHELAKDFGISQSLVSMIFSGKIKMWAA